MARRFTTLALALVLVAGLVVCAWANAVVIRSAAADDLFRGAGDEQVDCAAYGFLGLTFLITPRRGLSTELTWADHIEWFERTAKEARAEGGYADYEISVFTIRAGRTRTLRSTAWLFLAVGTALSVAAVVLALKRRLSATWLVVAGYCWLALGMFAVRHLIYSAFLVETYPLGPNRSDHLLRWHPAVLVWFVWTVLAILFAVIDRRRNRIVSA